MHLRPQELKDFLDFKADQYNRPEFIETDPIMIPRKFSLKEDIEVAGFLTATISWGNRKSIINNAIQLMKLMGESPFDFVLSHKKSDLKRFEGFVHRTFNSQDLVYFILALRKIYLKHGGMEKIFQDHARSESLQPAIHAFRKIMLSGSHPQRTEKHISDPMKGSAAKRINMFLRWMVRKDKREVDLGIWKSISPSSLSCPLDVHSGNVARKLGLLVRTQNDAKALQELDQCLRKMDAVDPVKYDFALFGLGVFEGF